MSVNNKDIGYLTLDDFKLWSSRVLKVFLSLRGKPTTGSFDTLAASHIKFFPYLLELNVVIFASVSGDGCSY